MNRLYIILPIAIVSYFGMTLLTEYLNPNVKTLSSDPMVKSSDTDISKLPIKMTGTFTIDRTGSMSWLAEQNSLNYNSKKYFASQYDQQKQLIIDSEKIQFQGQEIAVPIEIIAVREDVFELRIMRPENAIEEARTFFLESDKENGVWYSYHSHLKGEEKMLYKARYTRIIE